MSGTGDMSITGNQCQQTWHFFFDNPIVDNQVLEFQDLAKSWNSKTWYIISLVYVLSFEHFDGWSLEARTLVSVILLK